MCSAGYFGFSKRKEIFPCNHRYSGKYKLFPRSQFRAAMNFNEKLSI